MHNDKELLREKYSSIRNSIPNNVKMKLEEKIRETLFKNEKFKNASLVLIYVSTKYEVNTLEIIKQCFKLNKKVAVPRCIQNSNKMEFHYIENLNELKKSNFGILEPINSNIVLNHNNSICIIPGLAFDNEKNRLGYGKGYYDRFLKDYEYYKIGLCFPQCISNTLPTNEFDIKMDELIT